MRAAAFDGFQVEARRPERSLSTVFLFCAPLPVLLKRAMGQAPCED